MKTKVQKTFRDQDVIRMFHLLECAAGELADRGEHYVSEAFKQLKSTIIRNRLKERIQKSKEQYRL
jgi:hypothetical protein